MDPLRFSAINIEDGFYKEFALNEKGTGFLKNLSQINIFIGANNSGKSRFLRKLFSDEKIRFLADYIDINKLAQVIQDFKLEFSKVRKGPRGVFFSKEQALFDKFPTYRWLTNIVDFSETSKPIAAVLNEHSSSYYDFDSAGYFAYLLIQKFQSELLQLLGEDNLGVVQLQFDRIYIPTLRGLRPVQTTSSENNAFRGNHDNYLYRTVHDYFKGKNNLRLYTGLSLYDDIYQYSNGNKQEREKYRKFQKFLSETFFNNEDVELIAKTKDDMVHVTIGTHEEPVSNLGDGIQALLILTYPLFFNQGRTLKVFYEEPEQHLHPGYQRAFIETLLRPEFSNYQYFITTHSNHFLDMTLDRENISVYTFQQTTSNSDKPNFLITNVKNADNNILSMIGVKNSSVFLSNCTIWVEGISDRIYIRKYLELFQKDKKIKFQEDTHFSFVEYSGSNITHWSFLDDEDSSHPNIVVERLCGKLFLITDNDNAGFNKDGTIPKKPSKKAQRHIKLREKLNDRYHCLEVREIENLLTPKILSSVLNDYETSPVLDSSDLEYNVYRKEYLGAYIDTHISDLSKSYKTDSGSILNKVDFAKRAVNHMHSLSDISQDALKLVEKLYNFIQSENSI